MAPKKALPVTVTNDEGGTVLYDVEFPLADGTTKRMIVDMATILPKVQDYTVALKDTRGLPHDPEHLSAHDPILKYLVGLYADKLKKRQMTDAQILRLAQNYYARAEADVQSQAHLLAFFDHEDNIFLNEPSPYDQGEKTSRFAMQMPPIEKNLGFPIEYALKQIIDMLAENPAVIGRVMNISEELGVRINRVVSAGGLVETDEQGFQPGPTDSPVSEITLAPGV